MISSSCSPYLLSEVCGSHPAVVRLAEEIFTDCKSGKAVRAIITIMSGSCPSIVCPESNKTQCD